MRTARTYSSEVLKYLVRTDQPEWAVATIREALDLDPSQWRSAYMALNRHKLAEVGKGRVRLTDAGRHFGRYLEAAGK